MNHNREQMPIDTTTSCCPHESPDIWTFLDLRFVPAEVHAYVSSAPLALAGLAYALLQIRLKPRREILLKRLVLAGAFLLWAVVQLLPSGPLAVSLGDTVIAAYVLNLYWVMKEVALLTVREESLHE